jgi:hypothetical protein
MMEQNGQEPRISEFERELFARLSLLEQFQVLTLLESGIAGSVREALAEVREYQEQRGE